MKKPKPSIVLADYKFSDSDMLQYLVNLQRETMKILDEHHEAIEQLERITDEPVELPKEERCPNCDTVGCICTMQFNHPRREPKEKSLRDGDIPCFKCSKRHPDNWNCEYNLTYQRYLLDELSRVERVLKSKN